MKKINVLKSTSLMICVALLFSVFTVTNAYATNKDPVLEDYKKVAYEILDKYNMREKMKFNLYLVPENQSIEEYGKHMEAVVSQTAESWRKEKELKLAKFDELSVNKDLNNLKSQTIQPFSTLVSTKNYKEWETYGANILLKVFAAYTVTRTSTASGERKVISNVYNMHGASTLLGNAMRYRFTTTRAWHTDLVNANSFTVYAIGWWNQYTADNRLIQSMECRPDGTFGGNH